jgi:K+/H+ antiporter YhaU regulatory subunit KhtT
LQLFGLKLQEFTIAEGSELVGRPLAEAESRGQGGIVIVAIRHRDSTVEISPSLELVLAAEDKIFVMGHAEQVLSIARKAASERNIMFRGARM